MAYIKLKPGVTTPDETYTNTITITATPQRRCEVLQRPSRNVDLALDSYID